MQPFPGGAVWPSQQPPQQPAPWQISGPWPQPYPFYRPKRLNAKIIAGSVLVIVGLVFAVASAASSWWGMSGNVTASGTTVPARYDFYYDKFCVGITEAGIGSASMCISYVSGMESISNLFAVTFFLALVGVIFAILALASLLVGVFRPNARYALAATGLVASILLMIAPLYIFSALPGAFAGPGGATPVGVEGITGFFGRLTASTSSGSIDVTYGGGIGWYLSILAFVLLFVGTILAVLGIRPVPHPRPYWGMQMEPVQAVIAPALYPPTPAPTIPQAPLPSEHGPSVSPPSTPKPEGPPETPSVQSDAPGASPLPHEQQPAGLKPKPRRRISRNDGVKDQQLPAGEEPIREGRAAFSVHPS